MVGKTRGEVLGSLSAETGGIKESVWEEISRIRGRLDDCENLLVNSNEEIVGILNKKCYKADVVAALGTKADKNVVLNSLRLKADALTLAITCVDQINTLMLMCIGLTHAMQAYSVTS